MTVRRTLLMLALALVALPMSLRAQVGSTTDILTGRITGPDSTPVAGAHVEAQSTETGITRTTTTDAHGRYTILFPDGGGQYRLTVRYLGMAPTAVLVQRQADEDRLITNIGMSTNVATLAPVTVRGRRAREPRDGNEPGGTGQSLPPGVLDRLPIDPSDLNGLAALAPGVVGLSATDSTLAAFSVAGQPMDQNQITLDGLSFGEGSLPQEAIRSTRVITSTYDVARGQFTGGQIAATTRGGTNVLQGAGTYGLRSRSLEFGSAPQSVFSQGFTQNQFGGGIGGPLRKDKLFLFGAFQANLRSDDVASLVSASPATFQRLGASVDSIERFLAIENGLGIPSTMASIPDDRSTHNASALVRLDYNIGESHSLMLRGDWQGMVQDGGRVFPLATPSTGGNLKSSGGGGMLSLTSRLGSFINEFRGYGSGSTRDSDPYLGLPNARVIVHSALGDSASAVSTLQFGGNASLPQATRSDLIELSDEVSWLSPDGSHRVKLGMLFNRDRSTAEIVPNAQGTFTFNSLADLEAGRPLSFTRTLASPDRRAETDNGAVYLGDTWRAAPSLEITFGTRLEGSRHPDAPAYNARIDSAFGLRTDRFPSEISLTPRIGFTYFVRSADGLPPTTTIRGGFGEFRGKALSNLFALAANANGLSTGTSQIICVGPSAPTPDWASYLADPATIPAECAGPDSAILRRPNVTVIDPDFGAPRAWRGSLGVSHRFFRRYTLSLNAAYARGVNQTGARDLNLNAAPQFTLADEGNRPVYVPAGAISPFTGALSLIDSRRDADFGRVSEISSILHSDTRQLTLSFNTFTFRGALLNASYTFTRSRDQALGFSSGGFGGGGSTTAGDPNVPQWGTSDLERRHNFVLTLTQPITPAIEITAIGHLLSGAGYTPMVGNDINGDGAANDRAFIFDPRTTSDTAVANGMSRLLAAAPASVRLCLDRQLGAIAGRNSCASPWQSSLDLQVNIKPAAFGLDRRLTISVLALNTLAGIDQLVHGADHLHGWGQPAFPDRTLLYVRGFDPQSGRFLYTVNEHFGTASGAQSPFRNPFQLAIQARITLGPDPARQRARMLFGGARGRTFTPEDFKARLARSIPNPFDRILAINDSVGLALTPQQVIRLRLLSDTLRLRSDSLTDSLAAMLAEASKNPDPQRLRGQLGPRVQAARELAAQAIKQAEGVLTPEQWAKVPKSIKTPFRSPMGPPGGPGGGRGRMREPPDQ
jgi:hypothetical protein